MGKYTVTIEEILKNNVDIFDFNYPFYNDEYKNQFEEKFINHFYFDEIGSETVARFKHNLKSTLNRIMPYYTQLYKTTVYEYNPLLNYDLKEIISKDGSNTQNSQGTIKDNNKSYDTPINFSSETYKNSPSFITDSENINNSQLNVSHKEDIIRTTSGNIGVMSSQDLIVKERNIIINIDEMILDELNILFMGVY